MVDTACGVGHADNLMEKFGVILLDAPNAADTCTRFDKDKPFTKSGKQVLPTLVGPISLVSLSQNITN